MAFYIGDWTFAEAFARTQRHVTISVSHSSLAGYKGAEELLLNHLTTPNVLIRSAVVASCSLPGILKPSHLLSKVDRYMFAGNASVCALVMHVLSCP